MKILQSCGSRSWGGLEMQALLISKELRKRGHDVSLLCRPRSTILKEAYSAGVPTIGMIGDDNQAFGTIKDLSKLLKSYQFDVIHTHLSHDLWWLVPALKLASSDARLFLTKHMASGVKKTDPLHRFLYGRLQGTFAISNYIRTSILNTCPVPESEVYVLPPAISLEIYDPSLFVKAEVRNELRIPENAVAAGMVGRITPGKGHEEFFRAAKRLKESSQLDFRFLVIGTASFGEEGFGHKMKDLVDELGLTGFVQFTGYRKDIPRLLSALDVLAFPSHEESFGLALIEAMAMKVPVAASASAGVLDIVVDGKTGILFPPMDYLALADCILRLASRADLREEFGKVGRKRVEELFSVNTLISNLERYYLKGQSKD